MTDTTAATAATAATASKSQCRFCLESDEEGEENPLINPCDCKGSAKYVHWDCLRRWAKTNPVANGHSCKVCTSEFHVELFAPLEVIPPETLSTLYLENTSLLSFLVQFLYILARARLHSMNGEVPTEEFAWNILLQIQAFTHVLYVASFISNWRVQNRLLYLKVLWNSYLPRILVAHAGSIYFIFTQESVWMCFATYILLSRYWPEHIRTLIAVNTHVMKDR